MGHALDPKAFVADAESLIEGGADMLELVIAFYDPVADGPVIQAAGTRALSAGATPRKIIDTIGELSSQFTTPIVILTYYNPILAMGTEQFMRNANDKGVKGVVVPDLPMEESDTFRDIALKHNIRSEEHTSELQSRGHLVCRLLL